MKVKLENIDQLDFDNKLNHLILSYEKNIFSATIEGFENLSEDEKNKIFWIWEIVNGSKINFTALNKNPHISESKTHINPKLPRIYAGGGIAYLEPFFQNIGPTNTTKNGITVSLEGNPKILGYEWRKNSINNDGELITGNLQFGDSVQLHIYTDGLYGQEIEIQLIDIAYINEDLDIYEKENIQYKNIPNENKDIDFNNLPPKSKLKFFEREVRTYQVLNDSKIIVPESLIYESKNQKCILTFLIDPIWSFLTNNETKPESNYLHILPLFFFKSKPIKNNKEAKEIILPVIGLSNKMYQQDLYITGNKAVLVEENQIETNPAYYNHCRFNKITLKTQKKSGEDVIYNSEIASHRRSSEINIDIISGKKEKQIIDIDFETIECEQNPKHYQNEIKFLSTTSDLMELTLDIDGTKTEHDIEKKEFGWYKTQNSSTFEILSAKIKNTNKFDPTDEKEKFDSKKENGKIIIRQNQIELDTFYDYEIDSSASNIVKYYQTLKYFWLPNLGNKIVKHQFNLQSCVYSKKLTIAIYPDIKWTLKFGFNTTKDDIEALNKNGLNSPIELFTLETYVAEQQKKEEDFLKNSKSHKDIRHKELNETRKQFKLPAKAKANKNKDIEPKSEGKFSGLIDIFKRINISLAEEHYGGEEKNELSSRFIEDFYDKYKSSIEILSKIVEVIEGDHDKTKDEQDNKIKDFLNEDRKNTADLKKALQRKPVSYKVLYPKIALAASWYYDKIDGKDYPHLAGRQGLGFDINLSAKPLMGVDITWDLLELLCRKHPIAYAVLKAVDGLLYVLGDDGTAIELTATFTGQIDTEIEWKHNLVIGPKSVDAKCKASIQLSILFKVNIAKETHILNTKLILELGFSLEGKTGLGIQTEIGMDNAGFYSQDTLIFEGITFDFKATGIVYKRNEKGSKKDKKDKKVLLGTEISGSITLLECKTPLPKIYYN